MQLDRYAAAVHKLIRRRYDEWEANPPMASDIARPVRHEPLRKVQSVHGVEIAVEDEDWPARTFAERALHALFRSPVYPLGDDERRWRDRETAREALRERIGSRLIPRQNVQWEEMNSDAAQTHFAFAGLGAFHLRRLEEPDAEGAWFVVDMTHMASHAVRVGFERFGAAAYFGEDRQILRIFWSHVGHDVRPGDPDWPHAKFAWRSSVFVGLTVSDHLWGLHLRLGNEMVNATRECLRIDHPVRLLLKPYSFRTVAINHRAANVLVVERGLPHRAFGLTYEGLCGLLLDGERDARLRPFPALLAQRGTDDLPDFPFAEDGLALYAVFRDYISAYLQLYLPTDAALGADAELVRWWEALGPIRCDDQPLHRLEQLTAALTAFVFSVAGLHEHMGALTEYLIDPSFVSGRLRPGDVMGDQQGTVLAMLLMSGSGLAQPALMSDFSHLLPYERAEEVLEVYRTYQLALSQLSVEIGRRNGRRAHPYESMNPAILKCSVSI